LDEEGIAQDTSQSSTGRNFFEKRTSKKGEEVKGNP